MTSANKVGFIGQGFVGKAIANDLEERGFDTVRYSLEPEYIDNKDRIRGCPVVYIAVPTPTTPRGFDYSIITKALTLLAPGTIALIKSTTLPGTVDDLQYAFRELKLVSYPEFLKAKHADEDARNPIMNVIGPSYGVGVEEILKVIHPLIPKSSYDLVTNAPTAELIKYTHNIHGVMRVMFANMLFDLCGKTRARWPDVAQMLGKDPFILERSNEYNDPIHAGSGGIGRGAGGFCFIKDLAAFNTFVEKKAPLYADFLGGLESANIQLLTDSGKDLDILAGVYGE